MEGDKMDSPIQLLENTDQATKQALENVRKGKEKFDRFKKRHILSIWGTIILAASFFVYLYLTFICTLCLVPDC